MMDENIISINNLSFSINKKKILKDINLKIKRGRFIGLIGPNGAGKTTLLKCINAINIPEGNIEIDGKNIKDYNEKQLARKVALLNQNTQITFPFPCKEIVLMGRYPFIEKGRVETKEDYKIVRECMESTDTLILEKSKITEISGGERQRVLFAKVLAQQTDILLLDEPTASLDIKHEEEIFRSSHNLVKNGKTVIAAVHDLRIALKYCTELVLLKAGRIVSFGDAQEVITSENLKTAYDMDLAIYRNEYTGSLDYYIPKD